MFRFFAQMIIFLPWLTLNQFSVERLNVFREAELVSRAPITKIHHFLNLILSLDTLFIAMCLTWIRHQRKEYKQSLMFWFPTSIYYFGYINRNFIMCLAGDLLLREEFTGESYYNSDVLCL